jgi:hypothetical protein
MQLQADFDNQLLGTAEFLQCVLPQQKRCNTAGMYPCVFYTQRAVVAYGKATAAALLRLV